MSMKEILAKTSGLGAQHFKAYRDTIGNIRHFRDNGKENGNYYSILGLPKHPK